MKKDQHFAAITDSKALAGLLQAMDSYQGQPMTALALKLLPLVFVPPGELRHAEWAEVDLGAATWTIPAAKMKTGGDHIVPMCRQAIEILDELHTLTGTGPPSKI